MTIDKFNLITFNQVESTNSLAFDLLKKNQAANNSIIIANSQTKGRGRLDRSWQSPEGNLYFSLIIQKSNNQNLSDYSFLSACAIGNSLRKFGIETKYKWPNDIIFHGKKLAGILLQSEKINDLFNLVIGVGLNLVSSPDYAISLHDYQISKEEFLAEFCQNFLVLQNNYQNFGFETIRLLWKNYADKIGEKITLSNNQSGVFVDIDHGGNLILRDDQNQLQKIRAEEVL